MISRCCSLSTFNYSILIWHFSGFLWDPQFIFFVSGSLIAVKLYCPVNVIYADEDPVVGDLAASRFVKIDNVGLKTVVRCTFLSRISFYLKDAVLRSLFAFKECCRN